MEHAWQTLQGGSVLGVPLLRWTAFLIVTVGLFLVLHIARGIARRRLRERAARTGRPADAYGARLLERTWSLSLLAAAASAAASLVALKPAAPPMGGWSELERTVRTLALLAIFLQVGRWGTSLIDTALEQGFRFAKLPESTAQTAIGVVRIFALAALWASIAILILSTLDVAVTPLLAGLGVGGIAVGFALQRILGDIFCSVAIVLDRPFEVGDLIQAGEYLGTVERIGVKTTRVRSLGGEQIVFPNSDLLQSRIRNFQRMAERRVAFRFGVTNTTPAATVERVPALIREIIAGLEATRFDHAHFTGFGESAFLFEVVYFVQDPDSHLALDIQQRINLALAPRRRSFNVRLAPPKPLPEINASLQGG